MKTPRTLQEAIYGTIRENKRPIKELADDIGVSEELLYKYSGKPDESKFYQYIRRLLQIMTATGDNSILDYLEYKRGCIAIKLPTIAINKMEEGQMLDDYQTTTIQAHKALRDFINKPDAKNYKNIDNCLREVMSKSESIRRRCEKKATGQFEMELDN